MEKWLEYIIGFLIIPRWFMSIVYTIGIICIWDIKKMPPLIRASLIFPLGSLAIAYLFVDLVPFDFYIQSALLRLGNFCLMFIIIADYLIYRYGRKKNLL